MSSAYRSHGEGHPDRSLLAACGDNVILEREVMIFHPENIELGSNVYVGHQTILKAYYKNRLVIGDNTWIGQQCFFHSAGGLIIEESVGIGPGVKVLTSFHDDPGVGRPIMDGALVFAPVRIGRFTDIGTGAVVLPGVTIGEGTQVGAGAVVAQDTPANSVVAGVPAKVLRLR